MSRGVTPVMLALQFGIPGGPELLIVLLVFLVAPVVAFALAYYIYTDAALLGVGVDVVRQHEPDDRTDEEGQQ